MHVAYVHLNVWVSQVIAYDFCAIPLYTLHYIYCHCKSVSTCCFPRLASNIIINFKVCPPASPYPNIMCLVLSCIIQYYKTIEYKCSIHIMCTCAQMPMLMCVHVMHWSV